MIPITSSLITQKVVLLRLSGEEWDKLAKTSLLMLYIVETCCPSFTIVVKPNKFNDKLDLAIDDAVKSAFVHSCDGLAKAARLFYLVLKKMSSKDQSNDM